MSRSEHYSVTHIRRWLIRLTGWVPVLWFMLGSIGGPRLPGQETESKDQSALVDGLLDLLNEPAPAARPPGQPLAPATPTENSSRGLQAAPQSSPQADHRLQAVRQNMLAAATQLSRGLINQQTRQLQGEIVTQLDDLIQQMEQSQPSNPSPQNSQQPQPANPPESQSSPSEQQSTPSPSGSSQSSAPDRSESDAQRQPGHAEPNPDGPAQKGKAATATVDLADPKILQQNAWGQLPEQVRKQMQSRMVERFLPSYRQQIESYFQALLESNPDNP